MQRLKAILRAWIQKLRHIFFRAFFNEYNKSLAGVDGQQRIATIYHWLRDNAHENDVRRIKETIDIHPTVRWGFDTLFYGEGSISIGAETYLGRHCFVVAHPKGTKITIGAHCAISHNVHIRTQKHRHEFHLKDERAMPSLGDHIIIGDYVWIGANVFICDGVTIGENSIIGANSVVTHDIPPNTVCGGIPAKVLWSKHKYTSLSQGGETLASERP
jgi:maltose O-acetyltransferase